MNTVRIINADVMAGLATLPDESVHCCVTSPPYWGLRDYGTAKWVGGDAGCDHRQQLGGEGNRSAKQNTSAGTQTMRYRDVCQKCGATRQDDQIGLEESPGEFVERLVEVFREVRRVLRSDGTCWVNLGDSYASGGKGGGGSFMKERGDAAWQSRSDVNGWRSAPPGWKHKDLVGIPWRVAIALQSDGWYLRQDIIWHKPNPMPESVTDRCTKAHEYIFLLTKSPRYHYDAEAIKEPSVNPKATAKRYESEFSGAKGRTICPGDKDGQRYRPEGMRAWEGGRNKRSVWSITTKPYKAAHFATFPEELPRLCIKAGSPSGGTILDPFGGAGTSGLVAAKLGRDAILCELNPEYAVLARNRIEDELPLMATVELATVEMAKRRR